MWPFKKNILCPYCNQQLGRVPKRKIKCPHCAKPIYVRKGKLLTEESAEILDWLGYLDRFGITKRKFEISRDELSNKFKTKASVHDTVWYILNKWTADNPFTSTTHFAYREMGRLIWQEGKDDKPYIEKALHSQLMYYKLEGVKQVIVENAGGRNDDPSTCPQCAKLHGKKFTIDEAIEKMPIPRSCISESGCRCSYELYDPIKISQEYN